MNRRRQQTHWLAAVCILVIIGLISACSGSSRDLEKSTVARKLAKAVQAMAEGAEAGSEGLLKSGYVEREPNPNAYVGNLLYGRYCSSCHSSGKGPDILTNRVTQSDAESDYYIIRYGVGEMPAFRNRLTKFQILDILASMNVDFSHFSLVIGRNDTDGVNAEEGQSSDEKEGEDEEEGQANEVVNE